MLVEAWNIDRKEIARFMEIDRRVYWLSKRLSENWDTPRRWQIIREYYSIVGPDILAGHRRSPYGLGIENYLTPIEVALWQEIRMRGLPFYMQYPVGRRFVDFGDPINQIAIEADGAAFHSEEKDAKKNEDWSVFRIKGKDTFKENALENIYIYYGRDRDGSCCEETNGEGQEH